MEFNRLIGVDKPVFIVAEIGQNHQGDIEIAKKLIKVAKECGADCAKFQKTCPQEKFTKQALMRPYLSSNSWGKTYGEHKAFLEFSTQQFLELQQYAKEVNILFSASAMDLVSLNFLAAMDLPFIKIGSGDANNFLLLEEAAAKQIPLVISTGMQDFKTVKKIYQTVSKCHKKFALLHCVSSYPTPTKQINLKVLELYKREFPDIPIGYSGHETDSIITVGAVALGATIIERHITLNKNQRGSDHRCSLEPFEFKELVDNINLFIQGLGRPVKMIQDCEKDCYRKLRKTITASKKLTVGTVLNKNDIKIKVAEPFGLDGSISDWVIGKEILKDLDEDESITENCLKFN